MDRRSCPTWSGRPGFPSGSTSTSGLMFELQRLAFQADVTRVVTFMLGRELNFRSYPEIGITEGHHGLSHHSDNPEQMARYAKVNTYQAEVFASFLESLRSTPDGDGNLLDHSLLLYGAGLSNSNLHTHYDLPLTVFGGGFKGGRHVVVLAGHPDDEPAAQHARQGRRARRDARRQLRKARSRTSVRYLERRAHVDMTATGIRHTEAPSHRGHVLRVLGASVPRVSRSLPP